MCLVISLAGEEMDLTWSYPGVAAAIVPVSRPVLPHCLKKLVFTAAEFSIFMEATCVLISVIHWK